MRPTSMLQHAARAAGLVGAGTSSLGGRVPPWLKLAVAVLVVGLAGALLGIAVGGHTRSEVGPFQLELAVTPSWTGDSQLDIPPLGSIRVDSHDGPARLRGRVELLDEQRVRTLISNPAQIEAVGTQAVGDAREALVWLAFRTAVAAVTGAAVLGLIAFRSLRRASLTAAVGLTVVLGTLGSAAATWNSRSIREPHYEGLLTNVPSVIGDARSIYDRYGEYRGELIRIVTNLSRTYANLSTLPVYEPDPNTIRVLHVSDLHLHPSSFQVIGAIATQFKVDVVADTGDITHWGSTAENQYVQNIRKLNVPYVFIRGNHDSLGTAAAVAAQPNAVVLDNTVRQVGGLTFAGIGDGSFTPDQSGGDVNPDDQKATAIGDTLAETVGAYNASHPRRPNGAAPTPSPTGGRTAVPSRTPGGPVDVLMVHNPVAAGRLAKSGPLVLAGHTHERAVQKLDADTTLMVEGSTGANAFRGIGDARPAAMLMTLLYFSPSGQLRAYDEITVSGAGQSKVELERTIVANR